jgi:hypothetical protein
MTRSRQARFLQMIALCIALAVLLTPAALAAAPAPELTPPPPPGARCSSNPHGTICHFDSPFSGTVPEIAVCAAFAVDAVFSSQASIKRTYDAAGSIIEEKRHIHFSGTLANRETGASMIYTGSFIVTRDFVAQTVTITGAQGRLLLPDGGVDVVLAGRVVTDLSQEPPVDVFVAGPKNFDAVVCEALD